MRFKRLERFAYEDTHRKRLGVLRAQKRERDSAPLFAAVIGETQPDLDSVMTARVNRWSDMQQADRDRKAAQWVEGRRKLQSFDPDTRRAALDYWNGHKWLPGTPSYLLDMLRSIETGRLVRDEHHGFRPANPTIKAAQAMQINPTRKPPVLPGLTRPTTSRRLTP